MEREDFKTRLESILDSRNYAWIQNNGLNLIKDIKKAKILTADEYELLINVEREVSSIKINYWKIEECRSEILEVIRALGCLEEILQSEEEY